MMTPAIGLGRKPVPHSTTGLDHGRELSRFPDSVNSRVHASQPPQGFDVCPEGAYRQVGERASLEIADCSAVDSGSLGHVRKAQALSLSLLR